MGKRRGEEAELKNERKKEKVLVADCAIIDKVSDRTFERKPE
jgi:hypothetical protein